MKTILISGGNGKLATQIKRHYNEFKYNVIAPMANEMYVSNYKNIL